MSQNLEEQKKQTPLSNFLKGVSSKKAICSIKGISFVERFDANSYLYLTRCMDRFDLSEKHKGHLNRAFENNFSRWLLISFTSDWLFPASESKIIVNALMANSCDVSFVEIDTNRGHDSFFSKCSRFYKILKLSFRSKNLMYSDRQDHLIITSIVKENTRVLDVGCADGTLLKMSSKSKKKHFWSRYRNRS